MADFDRWHHLRATGLLIGIVAFITAIAYSATFTIIVAGLVGLLAVYAFSLQLTR